MRNIREYRRWQDVSKNRREMNDGGFAPCGYKLENGELVIYRGMKWKLFKMDFDRYIHTNDGINGAPII